MTSKQKSVIQLVGLCVLYAIIGGLGGPLLLDYILKVGETNPAIIFVIALIAVVFIGLGAGIKALAKVVHVTANAAFCYLPIAQDMVVHSVVKGIKTTNPLHAKIKKFNYLLTSTALIVVSLLLVTGSPLVFGKILSTATSSNAEEVATLMVTVNSVINLITIVSISIAYIVRVIYFDYIFRLVYKSGIVRILAILPPVHLVLIAMLPNQLNYLGKARAK